MYIVIFNDKLQGLRFYSVSEELFKRILPYQGTHVYLNSFYGTEKVDDILPEQVQNLLADSVLLDPNCLSDLKIEKMLLVGEKVLVS